jgi:serine phosphatase RsbU (regulator of sigma subunit)
LKELMLMGMEDIGHFEPMFTLTFLSDGVVEARNGNRELFGFERARQMSAHSAQELAEAARQFGQEDDITVLTLTLTGAAVPAKVLV